MRDRPSRAIAPLNHPRAGPLQASFSFPLMSPGMTVVPDSPGTAVEGIRWKSPAALDGFYHSTSPTAVVRKGGAERGLRQDTRVHWASRSHSATIHLTRSSKLYNATRHTCCTCLCSGSLGHATSILKVVFTLCSKWQNQFPAHRTRRNKPSLICF